MGQTIAEYYKIPFYANLSALSIEEEEKFHIQKNGSNSQNYFISETEKQVTVATDSPDIQGLFKNVVAFP